MPTLLHNLHLSHGRMAVERDLIALRVRFFKHDLEDALSQHLKVTSVTLADDAASDSLFIAYLNDTFAVISNGDSLAPRIVASGEQHDVWWYELRFKSPAQIEILEITNRTLFDLFDNQQNILYITHFPSEERRTLYFVRGAEHYQVRFRLQ